MHDTAMEIGCLVMDRYSDLPKAKVLELGSYDVNGSLRSHAPKSTKYIGLDLEAGPGVDFVVEPGKPWPVEDDHFDLVLASSVFEHDPMFWLTFLQMVKKVRTGGYIYISAPSNGSVHRYPEDHWRFYPDSGLALERWAVSQGQPVVLVESFTAGRKGDQWNDFVAVFRKGKSRQNLPKKFVHQQVRSFNVLTWNKKELANPSPKTEDMLIIDETRAKIRELDEKVGSLKWENQANWDERQKAEQALSLTEARLLQEQEGHEASRSQLIELAGNLERQRINAEAAEARALEFREMAVSLRFARDELAQQFEAHKQTAEKSLDEAAAAKAAELEELARRHQQARAELAQELDRQKDELERSKSELEFSRSALEESKAAAEQALAEAAEAAEAKTAEIERLTAQHQAALDVLAEQIERQKAATDQALTEAAHAKAVELEELAALHQQAQNALAEEIQQHQAAAESALGRLAESEASLDHLQAVKRALEEEIHRHLAALKRGEDLKARLTLVESTLAQREEEIAQTRDELIGLRSAHDTLRGERDSLEERVREADKWVFRLSADRRQSELEADRANRNLAKVETESRAEIVRLTNELTMADGERQSLADRVGELESALEQAIAVANDQIVALQQQLVQAQAAAELQAEARTADLAQLTLMLRAQEDAAERATMEASANLAEAQRLSQQVEQLAKAANDAEAAQASSLAEVQRLSELAAQLTNAANQAEDARTESERKLAARFDELARLTAILSEESRRAEASDTQSQWLRDVRRLEERFPAWWAVMPASWRQQRTHRRYARAGLFDAAAYLALYPDVAAQGMDPVRHYILHGMAEGRTRPVPF